MRYTLYRLAFFVCFVGSYSAQRATSQEKSAPALQHRSQEAVDAQRQKDRRIDLIVTAGDSQGKAVAGLTQQDFTVLDKNQPQTIVSFEAVQGTEAPVEVVLAFDLINIGFDKIAFERQEIKKFLLENDGRLAHPVRVVLVTQTGIQIQPEASRDGKAIAAALDNARTALRAIGRSSGREGVAERLQMSLKYFTQLAAYEESRPGRKMMLWISPGWPMLESTAFYMSKQQQGKLFDTIIAMTNDLRKSHITLYVLDPFGLEESIGHQYYFQDFLVPVTDVNKAMSGNLGVQILAIHSGGRVMAAGNDLAGNINVCMADAEPYYVISFDSAQSEKIDEYHPLAVNVSKPGVKARTTAGYYTQP